MDFLDLLDRIRSLVTRRPVATVCGLFVCSVFTNTACDLKRDLDMATTAVRVAGAVRAGRLNEHGVVDYTYSYAERTYWGTAQSQPPNPDAPTLKVGQAVAVFVDAADPRDSVLGDPELQLSGDWRRFLFGCALVGTYLLIVGGFALRRRLRPSKALDRA